ncbi:hypothetical protein P4W15_04550 [Morganella morganii]|uniref:hypothetical protein n=1 Tax=Morganella morganii TaxID=582 RepID=UPI001FFD5F3F|nr:hypothetical protein [Morganella morganii]MDF5911238.1 hypothetical protein [Morganella morganii]GIZ32221.1 hypothetical protein TUM12150_27070 [Morganella morganii]
MLDFNRQNLTHMTADALKKQRGYLWIIAILLLAGGVACLMNPLISGVTLSYIIGGASPDKRDLHVICDTQQPALQRRQ